MSRACSHESQRGVPLFLGGGWLVLLWSLRWAWVAALRQPDGAKPFQRLPFALAFQGAGSVGKTFPNPMKTFIIYLCKAERRLFGADYLGIHIWGDMLGIFIFQHLI